MIEKHLAAVLDAGLVDAPADGLTPAQLIDRIAAREGLLRRLGAVQQADLVAVDTARRDADRRDRWVGPRLAGRTVGTEVGLARGVSPTAGLRHRYRPAGQRDRRHQACRWGPVDDPQRCRPRSEEAAR